MGRDPFPEEHVMESIGQMRRARLARMRLYLVTGEAGDADATSLIVAGALQGGADVIQLRKKEMPKGEQYRLACRLRELTWAQSALLIINDHADIALAADADGVHLGQDDLHPMLVRQLGDFSERLIGCSTHSLEQARQAVADGADYLGVGPVFATPTKPGRAAVGVELLTAAASLPVPFVAIGGIDAGNAAAVLRAGAPAIAVVRAVYDAPNPAEAARRLRRLAEARLEVAS